MFRCVIHRVPAACIAVLLCALSAPAQAQLFRGEPDADAPQELDAPQDQRQFLLRGPTQRLGDTNETENEANRSERDRRTQNDGGRNTLDDQRFLLRPGVDIAGDAQGGDDGDETDTGVAVRGQDDNQPVVRSRVQEPVALLEQERIDRLEAPDLRGDRAEIDAIRTGTVVADDPGTTAATDADRGPFDPVGGRVGQIEYFPTLEIRAGYTDNAGGTSVDPSGSIFESFRGGIDIQSDWSRHEFTASGGAEYVVFNDGDSENELSADLDAALRLDITRRSTLELGGALTIDQTSVGDDGAPPGTTDRPLVVSSDIFAQFSQRFNRLTAAVLAGTQQETNQDGQIGPITIDNSDLDFRENRLEGSLTYELSPITSVGLVGTLQETQFDSDTAFSSDSEGYSVSATLNYRPSDVWEFEGSLGFESDDFENPAIGTIDEFIYDATLTWRPTILTSVAFTGERSVQATTESGSSAVITDEYSINLTHDFRENIALTLTGLFGFDDFIGSAREDERLEASGNFLYQLNRYVAFVADVGYAQTQSNLPGIDEEELSGSAGVRLSY